LLQVRTGIKALSQIVIGANALVQAAIPDVLTPVAGTDEAASLAKFNSDYLELLRNNAEVPVYNPTDLYLPLHHQSRYNA
jgi:hypothetical protein